jgi:hypothetical protein
MQRTKSFSGDATIELKRQPVQSAHDAVALSENSKSAYEIEMGPGH